MLTNLKLELYSKSLFLATFSSKQIIKINNNQLYYTFTMKNATRKEKNKIKIVNKRYISFFFTV